MIIAISGPSGCGKSTIAKLLAKKHAYTHLCQDDFWFKNRKFLFQDNPYDQHRFYELATEYDGALLAKQAIEKERTGVIVEGFTVMAYPEIRNIVSHHFHIDLPWNECVKRRISRNNELDPKSTTAWIKLGMQFNEVNVGFQRDLRYTTVLSGFLPNEALVETISNKILALSSKEYRMS